MVNTENDTDYWDIRSNQFCDGIKGIIARRNVKCWWTIVHALDNPISHVWGCTLKEVGKITSLPAVYFVVRNEEVIYVGKSVNPHNRWTAHPIKRRVEGLAGIEIFWIWPCRDDWLGRWEEYFIRLIEPIYNKRSMPKRRTGRYFFGEPAQAANNLDDLLNRLQGGEFG